MILDQIKELNKELEQEIGMKITKRVWDLINTLIIKVGQLYENNMDMNKVKLEEVYATISNNNKEHIRTGDTK